MKRTLITSALPYANGYLHLGHCAGAYLPADIYARFLRLRGEKVIWVCGSDEHGVAITIAAEKEKVTPKQIIDKYHEANKSAFDSFGMSFDMYSRTHLPEHHETAREFFEDLLSKDFLKEKEEEQFYDPIANMFLPDRYVEGICPNCGYDKARGDQCDNCGAYYNQLELKNPVSLVSKQTPVVRKTTHWYMKFNEFQAFLENYIESHAGEWKDNVLQQTRSWLKQGLTDRAITRDLSWGVSIEGTDSLSKEKTNGKVLYVWFEAVLGYISATKHLMKDLSEKGKAQPDDWKIWWQCEDTRYVAFIGKDNIVFHTLIFPAILHARGDNYILPDNVPANEFLNLEGQKFSKSRNWSIDLKDFINDFKDKSAIDAFRYTLAMNFPETKDADFTWRDFQARNNNELAAIFGNFVNRTLQFLFKNFEGKVPVLEGKYAGYKNNWELHSEICLQSINDDIDINELKERLGSVFSENDSNVLLALWQGIRRVSYNYGRFRFRDAISETMNIARAANKYFNDEEPWKTLKSNPAECAKTMYVCTELTASLSVLFAPIVPFSSAKLQKFLGIEPVRIGDENYGNETENYWDMAANPMLANGFQISSPEILFTKIEDEIVQFQMTKLGALQGGLENEGDNLISFDHFKTIKLRTARILEAENVPKSKKLIKLQVDLGNETRQIVAGIAEHYKPEELIGKTIVVVANLTPAKLMGVESNGMLLAANTADGKLCLVSPENPEIGLGAEVR